MRGAGGNEQRGPGESVRTRTKTREGAGRRGRAQQVARAGCAEAPARRRRLRSPTCEDEPAPSSSPALLASPGALGTRDRTAGPLCPRRHFPRRVETVSLGANRTREVGETLHRSSPGVLRSGKDGFMEENGRPQGRPLGGRGTSGQGRGGGRHTLLLSSSVTGINKKCFKGH